MDPRLTALLAGLCGMLGWGVSDFFAKTIIDRIGVTRTAIALQAIGCVAALAVRFWTGAPFPPISGDFLLWMFVLAAMNGASYLLLFRSFGKGVMTIVSPIASSAAGLSLLVCFFVYKEPITPRGLAGFLLILTGILLTSFKLENLKSVRSRSLLQGVPEALAVMVLMGFWFPMWGKFVEGKDVLFCLIALKITIGLLLLGYYAFTQPVRNIAADCQKAGWLKVIAVALVDVGAFWGVSWGYGHTTGHTGLITVLANTYALPTIVLSYFLLGERITWLQKTGVAAIFAGIVFSSWI